MEYELLNNSIKSDSQAIYKTNDFLLNFFFLVLKLFSPDLIDIVKISKVCHCQEITLLRQLCA